MRTLINTVKKADSELPHELLSSLPSRLKDEISSLESEKISELRLRSRGACSVMYGRSFQALRTSVSQEELEHTVKQLCNGSLYAFRDTINKGYISLRCGIRVGVCGRAVYENGKLIGVYDISSLCIRIPHHVSNLGDSICRLVFERRLTDGVLIYSAPGVGKTTLLRSITERLSSPPVNMRLSVIDTRGELDFGLPKGLNCDVLSGYEKGLGIEIAVRCLNPQLIVCDEIGADLSEAQSILRAHNSGVPLLASAHASDLDSLLRRPAIAELHRSACFGYYVGITRDQNGFKYTLNKRNEAKL